MEKFDESSLSRQLDSMPDWKWVAFILLCCERMVPNFERFSGSAGFGDAALLRTCVRVGWQSLVTGRPPSNLSELRQACEGQAPNTENFHSELTSAALDAANAVAILLDALQKPCVSMAVEVASLSRDSVDLYVQETRNLDPNRPTLETDILTDARMETELRRQRNDLKLLATVGDDRSVIDERLQELAGKYAAGSLSD